MMRLTRWAEMLAIFFIGPVIGAAVFHPRHGMIVLAALTAGSLTVLLLDPRFDRSRLWNRAGARLALRGILIRWAVAMAALTAAVLILIPDRFLAFPRERPTVWALVMVLYPVLSVYPQEVVWRIFFHHRYGGILPGQRSMIAASALAFGVMHIIFQNWPAVVLSTIGGVFFAHTYERTRSAAAVWFEHALYGCAVFTIGLGVYFYGGAVR